MKLAGKMAIIAGGLIVTGGIIVGITGGIAFRNFANGEYNRVDEKTSEKEYTADASTIKELDIALISEKVEINPVDGSEITIKYVDYDEKPLYNAQAKGNTLYFERLSSLLNFNGIEDLIAEFMGNNKLSDNVITIDVPKDLVAKYNIADVSGEINCNGLLAEEANIASTSGDIELSNISSDKDINIVSISGDIKAEKISSDRSISIATTSGKEIVNDISSGDEIELSSVSGEIKSEKCEAKKVSASTTSGAISISNASIAKSFEGNSTSGSITLDIIGSEDDYEIDLSSLSGYRNLPSTEGNKPNKIEISTISGDIYVNFK